VGRARRVHLLRRAGDRGSGPRPRSRALTSSAPTRRPGFTSHLPTWSADITLLAIAARAAICANALNVYSGSMSFLALGIKLPGSLRRAVVAIVLGVAGFFVALSGLHDVGVKYNNFLLVIAYWIGPWLGVFFADSALAARQARRRVHLRPQAQPVGGLRREAIAMAVSIYFFANQTDYVGVVPKHNGHFGDIHFEVGFVLAALPLRDLLQAARRIGSR